MLSKVFHVSVLMIAVAMAFIAGSGCQKEEARCSICYMPIPPETRVVISVNGGSPKAACDARCPLTYQHETGQKVKLIQVTDYETGKRLDPKDAVYVTGSDVAPDAHTEALRVTPADTAYLHWHRCLPSVLAFRKREDALRFQQAHGGTIMTLADLGFAGNR
jgi:hypothetical protein